MGLDIYLAAKDELGEVSYIEPDKNLDIPNHLSRWLCWAYCDYDELGKECILYRSIKGMGLDPEPLFLMEYFRYGELSYLDFLLSDAKTDAEKVTIQIDYEGKMAASWQPIEPIAVLFIEINNYLSSNDIAKSIYINHDYQEYFARKDNGGRSFFEKDMLYLMSALNSAKNRGLRLVSFDMG